LVPCQVPAPATFKVSQNSTLPCVVRFSSLSSSTSAVLPTCIVTQMCSFPMADGLQPLQLDCQNPSSTHQPRRVLYHSTSATTCLEGRVTNNYPRWKTPQSSRMKRIWIQDIALGVCRMNWIGFKTQRWEVLSELDLVTGLCDESDGRVGHSDGKVCKRGRTKRRHLHQKGIEGHARYFFLLRASCFVLPASCFLLHASCFLLLAALSSILPISSPPEHP